MFRLLVVTDRGAVPDGDLVGGVARALAAVPPGTPPGTIAVQLRAKDLGGRDLLELARGLREVTARAGALLLVNDRVDVALAVAADGAHLPGGGLPVAAARQLLGAGRLVGVSTHAPGEVAAAAAAGADYAVFGPVYATPSKARYGPPQGLERLAAAVAAGGGLPVIALGGIDADRVGACRAAGAAGVAAIRAILGAAEPATALAQFLAALGECG